MELKEAYKVMQAAWVKEVGLEVGDTVKVLRSNVGGELGSNACGQTKNELVLNGNMAKVSEITERNIWVLSDGSGCPYTMCFPFFTLEFIKKAEKKPEKMVSVRGKEYSEDTLQKMIQQYVKE